MTVFSAETDFYASYSARYSVLPARTFTSSLFGTLAGVAEHSERTQKPLSFSSSLVVNAQLIILSPLTSR